MKSDVSPSMLITYQRCNDESDRFRLCNWKSNNADVLWVALILDHLPSNLLVKFSQLANAQIIFNALGSLEYFLTQVPEASKFELKDVTINPFLSCSGLQDLKCEMRMDWKCLSFRFEFPVEQFHLENLKLRGRW